MVACHCIRNGSESGWQLECARKGNSGGLTHQKPTPTIWGCLIAKESNLSFRNSLNQYAPRTAMTHSHLAMRQLALHHIGPHRRLQRTSWHLWYICCLAVSGRSRQLTKLGRIRESNLTYVIHMSAFDGLIRVERMQRIDYLQCEKVLGH